MENIEFNAYVKTIISLVRTIVIKCESVAATDNRLLLNQGVPVSSDRRTWRYYLNMSGEYHPADTLMYVKSLDTDETILFNKANLSIHSTTYRTYSENGYLYTQLVNNFKAQRDLINGILNPIDIDTAIEADDYKILQYDGKYIESNEDQLIPALQNWINAFCYQHFDNDYFITDNLMLPINIGSLYGLMTPAIMTIREEAVGTRHVHSFHVWSKLNSYGDFQPYKTVLDKTQSLWLYRNIDWLTKNAGKKYTLNQLIENLLSYQLIPIADFRLTLDTELQTDELSPTPKYNRLPMNLNRRFSQAESVYRADRMVSMEADLAVDNNANQEYYLDDIENKGKHSLRSDAPTKLLESMMEDYTDRHEVKMMILLRDEWAYLAKKGLYTGVVTIDETPNGEQFRLTAGDAMLLWTYLTMSARGEDTSTIPWIYYGHVAKVNPPTATDLAKLGDERYLTPAICKTIASLKPVQSRIISSTAFYDKVKEIYDLHWQHKKMYAQFHDFKKRACVKNATRAMHEYGLLRLTEETSFDTWLASKELNLGGLTTEEKINLAWEVFQKATGFDVYGEDSLRFTQARLVELMMSLSSYTIHTYVEIDDGSETIEVNDRTDISFNYFASKLVPVNLYFTVPLRHPIVPKWKMKQQLEIDQSELVDTSLVGRLRGSIPIENNTTIEVTNTGQQGFAFLPRNTTLVVN